MIKTQRVAGDKIRRQIEATLDQYVRAHQGAKRKVKRQNSVSVRLRVIDPSFRGLDRVKREERVWAALDNLPDEAKSQITFVLLLTPEELNGSLLNQEFERPIRSRL
jgi:stress-induced morphogen